MPDLYKDEVIDPGDRASKLAHRICVESYSNCPAVEIVEPRRGGFRAVPRIRFGKHIAAMMGAGKMDLLVQNDGAGGKPQFFSLVGTPEVMRGLGWEIIAMCADDIARVGALPVAMSNEVQVKAITEASLPQFEAMMRGYGEALRDSHLANITGETAVMKHQITAFCDDGFPSQLILIWGGTCLGLVHVDRDITGDRVESGMPIVGLWENGYRCNGGTFFTNLLLARYGDVASIRANEEAMRFVRQLTVPSVSYASTISRLNGWNKDGSLGPRLADMRAVAHITGGGVWGKLPEALPAGIGACLDGMPSPPLVLYQAQKWSQHFPDLAMTDEQAYGTFHGGCGMLIVAATNNDADAIIKECFEDDVSATVVGHTTDVPKITIHSRFSGGNVIIRDCI